MKRSKYLSFILFSAGLLIFVGSLFNSCGRGKNRPDPEYIAAVSSRILGKNSPVVVEFKSAHDTSAPLASNALVLSPKVSGSVSWQDEYTLVFTPSESYKPGQRYRVTANVAGIPSFNFDFTAAIPVFTVELEPVQLGDDGSVLIAGIVNTDEDAEISKIEQTVSSKGLGNPSWTHIDGVHRFSFAPVKRGEESRTAEITWKGKPLGTDADGFTVVTIPGLDVFQMIDLQYINDTIEVSFSSNLKPNQDLRGFISLSGNTDVRYTLDGNFVTIYGNNANIIPVGAELLIQDLEDIDGKRLITPVQYNVPDRWDLPEVRFTGNSAILPTSQGAQLVIETKNVSGILVEAFQIYNQNMIQFLQVNNLAGTSQLDRVGEPVWTKAYDFQWAAADQNRWVRRGLDMAELSKKFPGGMFHIRISFRQRHIKYVCTQNHKNFSGMNFPNDSFSPYSTTENSESSYWDNYENSDDYEWYNYRRDPCHPAFYVNMSGHNITMSRNVLVSDLGLLAKRSLDGSWVIATTNLITARAAPNTDYKVLTYQGRVLHQGKTNATGIATIPASSDTASGSRLFVYAESNLGRAYLRINDSLALSVSHFDISGGTPSSGVRGLIYGERDVWRPGDNIYLTFLLADPLGSLPKDHPVLFELEDPRGRPVINRTYTSSVDGFYSLAAATAPDAPTGDWTARIRVGGKTFSKNIKIETVVPNRLKINLDFGSNEYLKSGAQRIPLESQWLYGAPASGLKADISVTYWDKETTFRGYDDYSFRDPSRRISTEHQNIWSGTLDNEGKAVVPMNFNPGSAVPGRIIARFLTRVFEPSGVSSSEQISKEYSPFSRYVGIKLPKGDAARGMLLTDTDHKADIVVLDEDGKLLQGNTELECAIYKVSWRWWWEKGTDESAQFASSLSRSAISRQTVSAVNGRATFTFNIKYPDWGRYIVIARDNRGGHAAAQIVYIDWPGWAGRAQEGGQGSQAMLTLTAGKQLYNTGEKAQIMFPSNKNASAFIVIEKGGNIIKSEWITCQEGTTRYEFNADQSMVPNIYVHVTLVQPHLQVQNDLPIRLYGITPVMVEDARVVINPQIKTQDNWQAESKVSFTVSEANGRPMAYTVAVVDEGLLGLTRFNLPNPKNTFYARDASFIKSWDLFQEVIGAFSGKLETLLAIGGGGGVDDDVDDPEKETQRFKPVVRFFGPFEIGRNGQKTETFDLPPYIGAVRIMVLAASSTNEPQTGRALRGYGIAQTSVKVTSDLMVFASLPRVLSPADEFDVPVYVNTQRDGRRSVKVNLSAPGAVIQGASSQDVSFEKSGEKIIRFKVKSPNNPGNITFTATAESPGLKPAQQVVDINVRSTAVPVTKSLQYLLPAAETWRGNLDYPGRDGTNSLVVSFSKLPPINLESRLDYLINYPHGCAEQTTSGSFPQLYLDKVLPLDDKQKADIRTNVNGGIERVLGMQLMSGGFSYWPGESSVNDWCSSYIGHFLLEARRLGYEVQPTALKNWINYQKNAASQWSSNSDKNTEQAYRLYTLALAGEADLGSMNRMRNNRLPVQASWRLAAAYWLAGQRDVARSMIKGLNLPDGDYRELSATFGSTLRDKAMILETLILINSQEDMGRTKQLFEEITTSLSQDKWLSTQETAYALIALVPYMSGNVRAGSLTLEYNAAGKTGNVTFTTPAAERSLGNVAGTSGSFSVSNRSSFPVYVRITSKGLPVEGREPALSEGLTLAVEYRDTNNRTISPGNLKLGDDMVISVRVRNTLPRAVEEAALVVPIPASWEIVNTRIGGGSSSSNFRYQDIRDDRVMTYFNLNRNEERTITFRVNKAYEGSFFRPAIHVYAMYDESIRALIPGVR